jgi:excisionase family DNA binding protein
MPQQSVLLKTGEVAKLFGVHPATVYRWVRENQIPHTRRGRTIRFSPDVIRPTGGARVD